MRPKSAILLVLALGCGLVAAIGINQVMSNRGEAVVVTQGETTPIFVALNRIGINELVKPENVKLVDWPKDRVPEGAITNLDQLEGRRAWSPIFPDSPILNNMLLEKGETAGGPQIPQGMRVVTVRIDDVSGIAGLLKPGDHVDLSVHIKANPQEDVPTSITRTFLQNVKVVAVGPETTRDRNGEPSAPARNLSLLVTPDQVEMVTQAAEVGAIRLSMRSPEDDEEALTDGSQTGEVLGGLSTAPKEPKPDLNKLLGIKDDSMDTKPAPPPVVDNRDHFVMTVWNGSDPEKIEFIDGKPVNEPGSNNGGNSLGLPPIPPSVGNNPPVDITPPAEPVDTTPSPPQNDG